MKEYQISFSLPIEATPKIVWQYYTDISLRKLWELDLEEFHIQGILQNGAKGSFKLRNSPAMEVVLSSVINEQEFTEEFRVPHLGILYFSHQVEKVVEKQSIIKAIILLKSEDVIESKECYKFLKQVLDDIIDKAFRLKELIER